MIPAKEIDGELWIKASDHHQAIKEALAQPEHIGFMDSKLNPIQRQWVGLTEDELLHIGVATGLERAAVEMISNKLKEKNT